MRTHSALKGVRFPRPRRRMPRSFPALEWVEDAMGSCARATAIGNRNLLVENYTQIIAFTEDSVLLNTARGPLCVEGSGLALRDVRPQALIIHGDIHRVELPCKGGEAPDEF